MNKNQLKNLKAVLRSLELNNIVFSDILQSIEKEQFILEEKQSYGISYQSKRSLDIDDRVDALTQESEALQEVQESFEKFILLMREKLIEIETGQFNAEIQPIIQKIARVKEQIKASRDPLFEDIARQVVMSGVASTSAIQRRYEIGYNRAGKIMDQLEEAGIVGPTIGGKPRPVLVDVFTLEEILNS